MDSAGSDLRAAELINDLRRELARVGAALAGYRNEP
jgi:hypothetical protein